MLLDFSQAFNRSKNLYFDVHFGKYRRSDFASTKERIESNAGQPLARPLLYSLRNVVLKKESPLPTNGTSCSPASVNRQLL